MYADKQQKLDQCRTLDARQNYTRPARPSSSIPIIQSKFLNDTNKTPKPTTQGGTIQRYTKRGKWKISENNLYKTNGGPVLYAHPNAPSPQPQDSFIQGRAGQFTTYTFQMPPRLTFRNDCGDFASFLATENRNFLKARIPANLHGLFLEETGRPLLTFETQQEIARNEIYSDQHSYSVNPELREAYFHQKKGKKRHYGYHVADVVAKDGNDNITCEADAGDTGRTAPLFDMYETGSKRLDRTFHGQMGNVGGYKTVKATRLDEQ